MHVKLNDRQSTALHAALTDTQVEVLDGRRVLCLLSTTPCAHPTETVRTTR